MKVNVLRFGCPFCKAKPNQPCKTSTGHPYGDRFHSSRIRHARYARWREIEQDALKKRRRKR